MLSRHGAGLSNLSVLPWLQPHNRKSREAGPRGRQRSHPQHGAALRPNGFASLPRTNTPSRGTAHRSGSSAGPSTQSFFVRSPFRSAIKAGPWSRRGFSLALSPGKQAGHAQAARLPGRPHAPAGPQPPLPAAPPTAGRRQPPPGAPGTPRLRSRAGAAPLPAGPRRCPSPPPLLPRGTSLPPPSLPPSARSRSRLAPGTHPPLMVPGRAAPRRAGGGAGAGAGAAAA